MSEIIDLNILFEKDEKQKVTFKSKDGQEFTLTLEVNTELALKSIRDLQDGKTEIESAASAISTLIKEQLDKDIKDSWIVKNVNWKMILFINKRLLEEIFEATAIINGKKEGSSSKKK